MTDWWIAGLALRDWLIAELAELAELADWSNWPIGRFVASSLTRHRAFLRGRRGLGGRFLSRASAVGHDAFMIAVSSPPPE